MLSLSILCAISFSLPPYTLKDKMEKVFQMNIKEYIEKCVDDPISWHDKDQNRAKKFTKYIKQYKLSWQFLFLYCLVIQKTVFVFLL